MNDIEKFWKYGKLYKEIHDVGTEIIEYLDKHCPGHKITFVPKEKEDKDNERDHNHNG